MTDQDRYNRALAERITPAPEERFSTCDICGAPIRRGEPHVNYAGGAVAHYFKSTCEEEQAFKQLQQQVWKGTYGN